MVLNSRRGLSNIDMDLSRVTKGISTIAYTFEKEEHCGSSRTTRTRPLDESDRTMATCEVSSCAKLTNIRDNSVASLYTMGGDIKIQRGEIKTQSDPQDAGVVEGGVFLRERAKAMKDELRRTTQLFEDVDRMSREDIIYLRAEMKRVLLKAESFLHESTEHRREFTSRSVSSESQRSRETKASTFVSVESAPTSLISLVNDDVKAVAKKLSEIQKKGMKGRSRHEFPLLYKQVQFEMDQVLQVELQKYTCSKEEELAFLLAIEEYRTSKKAQRKNW